MTTVRTYDNLAEAGFAKSLLESANIQAELADEHSYGLGYGPGIGALRLQVKEVDLEQARKVLAEGLDADFSPSTKPLQALLESEASEKGSQFPAGIFVAAGVALLAILFVVSQLREKQQTQGSAEQSFEFDYNQDGHPDHFFHYRGQYLFKATSDRNFDGTVDEWQECDANGGIGIIRASSDNNFDGKIDVWYDYELGQVKIARTDTDFNGTPDLITEFRNGLPARYEVRPNGSSKPIRTALLVHGIVREETVDQDGDGKADFRIKYDSFANPGEHVPVEQEK